MSEKIVSDYTGYDFDRINELNLFEYWLLLRDAAIYNWSRTEEGREYLENCWRMEQTKPEKGKLREKFGKAKGK